jgi:peptide methionine sulfoxide reductase MsrA
MYDPVIVVYEDLLEDFFRLHDPTRMNRQRPDVESQYMKNYRNERDENFSLGIRRNWAAFSAEIFLSL